MSINIAELNSLKQNVVGLKSQLSTLTSQYNIDVNKLNQNLSNGVITQDQYNTNLNTITQTYNTNISTVNSEINTAQSTYESNVADPYKDQKDNLTTQNNSVKNTQSNLSSYKSSVSSKISNLTSFNTDVGIIATAGLALSLNTISSKNPPISGMVNNTNSLIDKANNSQNNSDRQQAILSINSTLSAIQDLQNKIQSFQQKLQLYSTLITVSGAVSTALTIGLAALFASPSPSKAGANTISDKISTLNKDVNTLKNIVNIIIPPILNIIINDLNTQENRIEQLNTVDNSSQTNTSGSNVPIISSPILSTSSILGVVPNTSYKGFTFVIKETTDPNFIVGSIKANYAVAINNKNQPQLQTDPSFTLNPQVLVSQLELQIDELGL